MSKANTIKEQNETPFYEKEIVTEKIKFETLSELQRADYLHETKCMFEILSHVSMLFYENGEDKIVPTEDGANGLYLLFTVVEDRISAIEDFFGDKISGGGK